MSQLKASLIIEAYDRLTAPVRRMLAPIKSLEETQKKLTAGATRVNQALDDQKRRLEATATAAKRLEDASARLNKRMVTAGAATFVGREMSRTGGAVLKPLMAAAMVATGFEASMSQVEAVTNASAAEFALLRNEAKRLGAETFFSASEVSAGQGYLGMAGFRPDEIVEAMPSLLDTALAGKTDLGATSDIVSNILSGFQMEAKETARVADVLTKTFTTSNTTLTSLGEAMSYAAPAAAALNVPLEEASAFAGLLGNIGIQGSRAGTVLNAALNRLAAPRPQATEWLERLNVETRDAQGNLLPVLQIMEQMAESTGKLGSADRAEAFRQIFGMEAAAPMVELIAQAGAGGIRAYREELMAAGGTSARVAATMANNTAGAFKALGSATEGLQISLGDLLAPVIRTGATLLTGLARVTNTLVNDFPFLAKVVAFTVGGLGVLAVVAGTVVTVGGAMFGTFAMAAFGLEWLSVKAGLASLRLRTLNISALLTTGGLKKMAVASVVAGAGGLAKLGGFIPMLVTMAATAIPAVTAALGGVAAAVFAIPGIGWIAAAVTGVAFLIWRYWGPIKAWLGGFWDGLLEGVQPVMDALGQAWGGISQALSWITSLVSALFKIIAPVKEGTDGARLFGQVVGAAFSGLVNVIMLPIHLLRWLGNLVGTVAGHIANALVWVVDKAAPFINFLQTALTMVEKLVPALMVIGKIRGFLFGGSKDAVPEILAEAATTAKPASAIAPVAAAGVMAMTPALATPEPFASPLAMPPAMVSYEAAPLYQDAPGYYSPEPVAMQAEPFAFGGGGGGGDIIITFDAPITVVAAPGMDAEELATLVQQKIEAALAKARREAEAAKRGRLYG